MNEGAPFGFEQVMESQGRLQSWEILKEEAEKVGEDLTAALQELESIFETEITAIEGIEGSEEKDKAIAEFMGSIENRILPILDEIVRVNETPIPSREQIVETAITLFNEVGVSGQEKEVANLILEIFKKEFGEENIEVEFDEAHKNPEINGDVGNMRIVVKGNSEKEKICLSSHMDMVVAANGEGRKDFQITPDGRLINATGEHNLGADDKMGAAAIIEAIKLVKEADIDHGDIVVLQTIYEEDLLRGAKNMDPNLVRDVKNIYVLDGEHPSDIITSGVAKSNWRVELTHDTKVHTAMNPEDAPNLLFTAARAITKISERISYNGWWQNNKKTGVSINVGTDDTFFRENDMKDGNITGKPQSRNSAKTIEGTIRIPPEAKTSTGETMKEDEIRLAILTEMEEILKEAVDETKGEKGQATARLIAENPYPSFEVDKDRPIVTDAIRAAIRSGQFPKTKGVEAGTEANFFNTMANAQGHKIEAIVLGVGIEKIHSEKEAVILSEAEKIVIQVYNLIKEKS